MAHIKAPVPITGIHVTLDFVNGEADTENEWLIHWFETHGYEVVETEESSLTQPQKAKARKADPNAKDKP